MTKSHEATTPVAPLASAAGTAVRWRGVGMIGSKLLTVARSLLLAWILTPDDFGLFALAIMPLDLALGFTETGILPALVQRADAADEDFDVAWTVSVLRGLTVSLLLFALAAPLAQLLGDARAERVLQFVALRPAIAGLASTRIARLQRDLDFRSLALMDLGAAVAYSGIALGLASRYGVWALVGATLGGTAASVIMSYVIAPAMPRLVFETRRAGSLLTFGRWVLVAGLAAMLAESVVVTTVSRVAGTAALGRYSLAASIALTPAAMAGSLIGGVAFSVHSRVFPDRARMAVVFGSSLTAMMLLVIPLYGVLVALAPSLVATLLDPRWQGMAPLIQLLAFAGVLGLVYDAAGSLLSGAGMPQRTAILGVTTAAAIVLCTLALTGPFGASGAAGARVAAEVVAVLASVLLLRGVIASPAARLARPAAALVVIAVVAGLLARVVADAAPGVTGLIAGGFAGTVAAASLLLTTDQRLGLGVTAQLRHILPAAGRS